MLKVKVKIYNEVTERSGENDKGPWSIREQSAQIDGGTSMPSQPFSIRLDKNQVPYAAGDYNAELKPQQGRFRGSLDWIFTRFEPVK